MKKAMFDRYSEKLDQNVYNSLKGRIRLELLLRDISEYCPNFRTGDLEILDVGGGAGHFAELCLQRKHRVTLCDSSTDMIEQAEKLRSGSEYKDSFTIVHHDFLCDHPLLTKQYDLVLMHGSAEWMAEPAQAIKKALGLVKPDGFFSLLIFNKDKYDFKRGCNGHLLEDVKSKKKKLIPPGAMTVKEVETLLASNGCRVVVQSGIRVFYNFFRQFEKENLTEEQWLEQELRHYRQAPFSLLGEHSHFVCSC